MQTLFLTHRWYLLAVLAAIIIIGAALYFSFGTPRAIPDTTVFQSGNFSFSYPRVYRANEYASGVVSVGGISGGVFIPLINVVRYKSDPDIAPPKDFDAFVARETEALCGTDAGIERVSCANPVATPYTSGSGLSGKMLMLTLSRKNISTGTTTSSTYGPIFVFNTTASSTLTEPVRYEGVFVYPTFSSFLAAGTTSPEFVEQIAFTIAVTK